MKVAKENKLTSKATMLRIINEELFYREFYRKSLEEEAEKYQKDPEDTKNENIKKRT